MGNNISPVVVLYDSSGTELSSTITDIKTNQESAVDSNNSTVAQLAIDAVFTGTATDCIGYAAISAVLHSDVSSAIGGLEFQWSMDGSNWDDVFQCHLDISLCDTPRWQSPIMARYFRLKYTNGGTATTEFRVQTILHRNPIPPQQVAGLGMPLMAAQLGSMVALETDEGTSRWLQGNEEGRLKVITGEQSDEPLHVTLSTGKRSYYHQNLVDADEPAEIDTGADEPYDVGGDTLTIDVNTVEQTSSFPTRVAQAGVHYSAPHPGTANGGHKKLKVSIDGGALKEVVIAEDLSSGTAIASALQVQIRALVENGTNMTVEYNTSEYPFRYVFKSGTTGASSVMHVEKGGDDLAKDMFVGTFGGTERVGLAADNYWAYEVVQELTSDLSDVVVYQEGSGVHIKTVAGGTSATLQVSSGGANTAFQFPTTLVSGVAGSGSDDLAVDGSTTAVRYSIVPDSTEEFVVSKLEFFIRDDGAALNKFAGQAPLTNGVKLEVKSEELPLIPFFNAKTNADLMSQADEGSIIDNGFTIGGQDLVKAVFDFSPGLRVTPGGQTNVYVYIQDDLSVLDGTFTVRAKGWVEAPSNDL